MKTTLITFLLAAALAPPLGAQEAAVLKIPDGTPAEVREALTWYDSLGLPSSRGLQRVRVSNTFIRLNGGKKQVSHMDAWLVEEKDGQWRLRCGPEVQAPFGMDANTPWPLEEWTTSPYSKTEDDWQSERTIQKSDFKAEAEALLAEINRPSDPKSDFGPKPNRFGMVLSNGTATFIIGRECLEHGLSETGLELLKFSAQHGDERGWLRRSLEEEFAQAALWRITLRFSVPEITRETLLAEVETALKQFPATERVKDLKAMAERLRTMIAEEREHAAKLKPFVSMTPAEQAAELVFQLRNQTGRQDSQPGQCDIFSVGFAGGFTGPRTGEVSDATPAGKLVKLGYDAVPALIEALPSETYSRAVGFWRDFRFSHSVLTVGDCAQQTLEVIAGRSFYTRKTTSGYMSLDEKAAATKEDAEKWWRSVRDKGERQALIDFVLAGDEQSPSQAFRLKQRYPDDAPAVLLKGAEKCEGMWPRMQMIQLLHDVQSEPVTAFLRKEMSGGAHTESRRAALHIMLTRDQKAARRVLIEEWDRLTGQFTGVERYHVMLQKRIGNGKEFDSHEWTERLSELLQMIYLAGGPEAIAGVASGFVKKPGWIRAVIISNASAEELERAKEAFETLPETERKKAATAMEALLLKALDDRTDRHCDDAAEILHERWPEKYAWEESESVRRRDAQIIAMKNVRRKELGQPPLPAPEPVKIAPSDKAKAAPLLEALAAAKDDAGIAAAMEALVTGPGLSVLPLAAKRLVALPKDDPQAARWQRATAALACIVRVVETDPKAKFIAALPEVTALKGRVLTPELLQATLLALFRATPDAVAGYHFRADRDDDGAGFVVRITALTEKSSQSPDWWALQYAGNTPCRDLDGEGRGYYGDDFREADDGFEDIKDNFTKASAVWNRPAYINYRAARQER